MGAGLRGMVLGPRGPLCISLCACYAVKGRKILPKRNYTHRGFLVRPVVQGYMTTVECRIEGRL